MSSESTPRKKSPPSASIEGDKILAKLDSIESAVRLMGRAFVEMSGEKISEPAQKLSIFISRTTTPGKPYSVQCDGIISTTFKLSPIRAAIFLVLILDLEDRSDGGAGVDDPTSAINSTLATLSDSGSSEEAGNPERIRVAVYRFWEFCDSTNHLKGAEYALGLDDKRLRFFVLDKEGEPFKGNVEIEVTSNDPVISSILSHALTRSPKEQVRRKKALFIPPGVDGADRFLLEMYEHPHKLLVTSLYVRPPLQSYPDELLKKIGVSPRMLKRKALAFEGYRSGRFHFLEILNEHTIWNTVRKSPSGGFLLYPAQVTNEDIIEHLYNLVSILTSYDNYQLHITRMVVPFVLVNYEIQSTAASEHYTVFFQAFGSAAERDLGCFAIHDQTLQQSVSQHIVKWLMHHPSTLKERGDVTRYLHKMIEYFKKNGPLNYSDPIPNLEDEEAS